MASQRDQPIIRLLVFDVNGVLYHYEPDVRVAVLAAALDRSPRQVEDAMFTSGLEEAADAGRIGPDDYLRSLSEQLDVAVDRDTWRSALTESISPNEPLHRLITGRRRAGRLDDVRMVTLSNNGLLVQEEAETIFPELVGLGVEFHVAAELGGVKPAIDVYDDLCTRVGVEPAEAAFVDDKQANVDGARRAGLHAHHFSDVERFETFLSSLGVAPAG